VENVNHLGTCPDVRKIQKQADFAEVAIDFRFSGSEADPVFHTKRAPGRPPGSRGRVLFIAPQTVVCLLRSADAHYRQCRVHAAFASANLKRYGKRSYMGNEYRYRARQELAPAFCHLLAALVLIRGGVL